jgi:hypothetical protein
MIGTFTVAEPVGIGEAIVTGLATPPAVWMATARGIVRMFAGDKTEVTGSVGIVREANRAAKRALGRAFQFAAVFAAYVFPMLVLYAMLVTPLRPWKNRAVNAGTR